MVVTGSVGIILLLVGIIFVGVVVGVLIPMSGMDVGGLHVFVVGVGVLNYDVVVGLQLII